jgi:CheY-like chemotaxis protein
MPIQAPDIARSSPCVLLVEDEPIIRMLLADELRGCGLVVIEAPDADTAWAWLQNGGRADLLFTDIAMPGALDGVQLVRLARAAYPQLPAIVTSANPRGGKLSPTAMFLPKPFRLAAARHAALSCLGSDACLSSDPAAPKSF